MNPGRILLLGCAVLLLPAICGTASPAAEPAPAVTAAAVTTPPPGSRERRSILDVLRAELSHLTGPDLVFVVAVLRVREGWAWIEAAPQSRDGARRYEDITALLQRRDGSWAVQVLGPCDEEDDPAACAADTDRERLLERFPTLPPDLVPRDGTPHATDAPEDTRASSADGCPAPRVVRGSEDWAGVFAALDWTSPRVSPPWRSAPSDDLRIVGRVVLDSARIPRDPTCRVDAGCRPRVVLAMPSADLPGVRCTRTLESDTEVFCDRMELRDTLVRWRAFRWSLPPWSDRSLPMVQFIPACATPCPAGQVRCATDHTCWPTPEAHCIACPGEPHAVCACRDVHGDRPDGAACAFMIGNDRMTNGQCRQGRCVPTETEER